MRTNWLITISAAICAAGMAVHSAQANPAGMALSGHRGKKPVPASQQSMVPGPSTVRPSGEISPFWNPIKYLQATVSEIPIGSKSRSSSGNASVPPAMPRKGSVSYDMPVEQSAPELMISMAQSCERAGNVPEARQHFQRALGMWPGHPEVLRAAARMEDRLGQLPLAELLYRQAVSANPQHAGALNDLGLCLARQGKLDVSLELIEQAVQLQPTKPLYRNNAATILVELRQDQRALAHLAAVHGSAEAHYNLGQLLVQRGRPGEAMGYFIAAIEQKPEMQAAHDALARLQGGVVSPPWATETVVAPSETAAPTSTIVTELMPNVATQPASPVAAPGGVPQQAPSFGPQFEYPATARSPELGQSSFVPPGYYPPTRAFPQMRGPQQNVGPHYLPPVANQPGSTIRR